jgi:hypothetical protein
MYPGCRIGHFLAVLCVTLPGDILNVKEKLGRPRWDQGDVLASSCLDGKRKHQLARDSAVIYVWKVNRGLDATFVQTTSKQGSVCLVHPSLYQYAQRTLSSHFTPLYL